WQPLQIEQAAVAVNGGQAVPEFVRDARREFAEPRQTVLEPELILEIGNFTEVGEQADRAVFVTAVVADRRDGDPQMRRACAWSHHPDGAADDGPPRDEALMNDVGERGGVGEDLA